MGSTKTGRWYRLTAGSHTMTTWIGDDQLTYRAVRSAAGWVVTRHVAGAGKTIVGHPTATLREAKVLAQSDLNVGFL